MAHAQISEALCFAALPVQCDPGITLPLPTYGWPFLRGLWSASSGSPSCPPGHGSSTKVKSQRQKKLLLITNLHSNMHQTRKAAASWSHEGSCHQLATAVAPPSCYQHWSVLKGSVWNCSPQKMDADFRISCPYADRYLVCLVQQLHSLL